MEPPLGSHRKNLASETGWLDGDRMMVGSNRDVDSGVTKVGRHGWCRMCQVNTQPCLRCQCTNSYTVLYIFLSHWVEVWRFGSVKQIWTWMDRKWSHFCLWGSYYSATRCREFKIFRVTNETWWRTLFQIVTDPTHHLGEAPRPTLVEKWLIKVSHPFKYCLYQHFY